MAARDGRAGPGARAGVSALLAVALAAGACGTRVGREEVVAAARGAGGAAAPGTQQAGPGGVASLPGAPGPSGQGGAIGGQAAPGAAAGALAQQGPTAPQGPAAGPVRRPSKAPIVLGSVGNYSGPPGASLAAGPQALQIWARWINDRGGLLGHPIEVRVVDDGTDPARYNAALKDLVENRRVLAFVGQFAPFTIASGKDYLERVRVPVIGGDCSAGWYTSKMFFPQCSGYLAQLYGTISMGVRLGKVKRLGALFCAEADVCAQSEDVMFNKGLAREAGADPVYRSRISIAQPDFTAECIGARNERVEMFWVVADVNTVGRVASSCARQDFFPLYVQSSGTMNAEIATRPVMDGTLVQLNDFPPVVIETLAAREYQEAYRQYAPGVGAAPYTSQGWAAAKLFQRTAEIAGEPLTRERLLEALWTMRNETLGGLAPPLGFAREKPPPESPCWFVMKVSGRRYVAPWGDQIFCRR